jgi:hypothetical protein
VPRSPDNLAISLNILSYNSARKSGRKIGFS